MAKKPNKARSAARRRAEERTSGFTGTTLHMPDGMRFFECKSDKVRKLTIADYTVGKGNPWADEGQLHYERTFFVHRGIGVDGNQYVCLAKTFKKKCPICEDLDRMRAQNEDPKLIKDLTAKERQLFVVRDDDEPEKGWQLWDYSHYLFGKQLDERIRNSDEEDGYENFGDWDEGLQMKVGFSEESFGGGRPFYKTTTIDFRKRPPLSKEEVAAIPCLDDLLVEQTYDKLQAIYLQCEAEEAEEAAEEPKAAAPAKSKPTKGRKPKAAAPAAPEAPPEDEPEEVAVAVDDDDSDDDNWDDDWD